jgi:hypothetical protein
MSEVTEIFHKKCRNQVADHRWGLPGVRGFVYGYAHAGQ